MRRRRTPRLDVLAPARRPPRSRSALAAVRARRATPGSTSSPARDVVAGGRWRPGAGAHRRRHRASRRATPASCCRAAASRSGTASPCLNTPGPHRRRLPRRAEGVLVNTDPHEPYEVHRGDRIAQLVIQPVDVCQLVVVDRARRRQPRRRLRPHRAADAVRPGRGVRHDVARGPCRRAGRRRLAWRSMPSNVHSVNAICGHQLGLAPSGRCAPTSRGGTGSNGHSAIVRVASSTVNRSQHCAVEPGAHAAAVAEVSVLVYADEQRTERRRLGRRFPVVQPPITTSCRRGSSPCATSSCACPPI